MMRLRHIILFFILLAFSGKAEAAFNIYLKNGSVISGISSYESSNGEVILYIGGGSISLNKEDILKIQETGGPEKDIRVKGSEKEELSPQAPAEDDRGRSERVKMLREELDTVTAEIRKIEIDEGKLVAEINEKRGRRFKYNIYQLKQLEKETEPLQQELFRVQQRKNELLERRAAIESELRSLER